MKKIKIICDSCSSITKEEAIKLNVDVIPVMFEIAGKEYNPTLDDVMDYEEFYSRLENKEFCKTSCINPSTFINRLTPYLEEGYDILFIPLSSGLTSSFNNFYTAKSILADDFDNKMEAIDPRSGSLGNMFTILEACKMRDEGMGFDEIYNALHPNKLGVVSLFTIGSLDHLRRGGRLSKISAILGTLLHINPIIKANEEGKLEVDKKHRGRKRAINDLLTRSIENAKQGSHIFIGHTNCKDEALQMKETIESMSDFKVSVGYIDHTMGSHCGPKTIAVFYIQK